MKKKKWWILGIMVIFLLLGTFTRKLNRSSEMTFSEKEEVHIYQLFLGEHNFTTKNIIEPFSIFEIELVDIVSSFNLQVEDEVLKHKLEDVSYRNYSDYQTKIEQLLISNGLHQDLEKFQVYGVLISSATVKSTVFQLEKFQKAYPSIWWKEV